MHNTTTCEDRIPGLEVARFLVVTIALGVGAQIVAIRAGLRDGGMTWLGLTMWAPAVAVACAGPISRARVWSALKRPALRFIAPALLLGFAPRLIATSVLALTGWGVWDAEHFQLAADGRSVEAIRGVGVMLGSGPQSFPFFALNILLSITLAAFVIAFVGGIGEEIGWRGLLQPALAQRLGATRGTIVVGLIWAYWHLPANLYGYNDGEHPVLSAVVLFPLAVVAMSFGFAWITRRSGSVWPAAVAHGANNVLGGAFLLKPTSWLATVALELLGMGMVCLFVAWRIRKSAKSEPDARRHLAAAELDGAVSASNMIG